MTPTESENANMLEYYEAQTGCYTGPIPPAEFDYSEESPVPVESVVESPEPEPVVSPTKVGSPSSSQAKAGAGPPQRRAGEAKKTGEPSVGQRSLGT